MASTYSLILTKRWAPPLPLTIESQNNEFHNHVEDNTTKYPLTNASTVRCILEDIANKVLGLRRH
jgi:hypothetical protein